MNKTVKKLISSILIVLCIFNFFYSNYAPIYAVTGQEVVNTMINMLGGVVGLLTIPFKLLAVALGLGVNILTAQIAYMDDTTQGADVDLAETVIITPFEIFFNKAQILDVNFLDVEVGGTTQVFRTAVAQWYYIMRLIAVSILLLILIYVGIRMAISTVASEKAMYKKSLVDWVTSLALVFLLQYIIMFTVHANAAIVAALEGTVKAMDIEDKIFNIALMSLGANIESFAATAIYVIFVIQVLMFVLRYIKRMLTVAFLIIISPLISITYSIDKMGDGKAQALNTWLKEFVYNVLIQPFHCVIYMAFIGTAFKILSDGKSSVTLLQLLPSLGTSDLANAVLAIMCMLFVDDAEKIVKKIFGFDAASSLGSSLSTLAMAGMIAKGGQKAVGAASGLRKSINFAKEKGLFAAVKKDAINFRDRKQISQRAEEIRKDTTKNISKKDALEMAREEHYTALKDKDGKINAAVARRREKYKAKNNNSTAGFEEDKVRAEIKGKYDKKQKKKTEKRELKNKVVGKIKSTNIGKYYYENSVPKAIGIFTGVAAGMANPLAGVAAGMAVSEGASQFFKTSKNNIIKDVKDYTHENTDFQMINQRGNNGEFEKDSEKMKQLMNDIKEALNELKKNGQNVGDIKVDDLARQIQSSIIYQKQADPKNFNMAEILRKAVGDKAMDDDANKALVGNLEATTGAYAEFQDDSLAYAGMKKGLDLGMTVSDFTESLNPSIAAEKKITVDNIVHHITTEKSVQEIVHEVDKSDVDKAIARIEEALKNPNIKLSSNQRAKFQETIDELNNKK